MSSNPVTEAMLRAEDRAATDPTRDRSKPMPPFAIRNLSVLAYANGFTLWHYKSDGPIMDTAVQGFFGGSADMMAIGDFILVTGISGGTIRVVTKADAGHVNTIKLA